ncbi:type II toxin-antitoxin system HipA family toxin [Nocardia sp. ET3-3]|uniref:Type II toxin-antitoxin system HipA family toxin n=1 Tax=Nocardia terrae TaxID=2675851 RepID=A0A7K1V1H7_9NOCA|nr:HipA domain-containing protein [Nocardia terrae]MVU80279.1 type II toxin-antitoxin system HipA family toxin [Nocardia terrae]
MALPERSYAVLMGIERVGTLLQRGDFTRFVFSEEYLRNPVRPVLGLTFEQSLTARQSASLRLPPWFSNLLPEGVLRDWIATARGVSAAREMELLAQVGHDLPGAVRVMPCPEDETWEESESWDLPSRESGSDPDYPELRFSLAGVAMKFSMLAQGDRLTLPAYGQGGDWIVKLPDRSHSNVPLNEYTMMRLADAVGIDVPEVRLYQRDELETLPPHVWPNTETVAYAVKRFDRTQDRSSIHIEDLAQVRDVYPSEKYAGNYETVASLIYRRRDVMGLREFARRLAFNILVSNGDAHLKNWSLIYRNPGLPTLAPAYDLVSTRPYMGEGETLAMKLAGSRRFDRVTAYTFERLERRLSASDAALGAVVSELVEKVHTAWPQFADELAIAPHIRRSVAESIEVHGRTILSSRRD